MSGSRSFDGSSTTFTFELGGEDPQQVELVSCPEGVPYTSASGPNGAQPQPGEGNIKHDGARFPNAGRGTYTITYNRDVSGAQIVVSPAGNRHRHYNVGTGCPGGTPASTTSSSTTTSTTEPPTTTSSSTTTTTEGTGAAGEATSTTSSSSTTTTTEGTTGEPPTTTTTTESEVGGAVESTTSTTGEISGETAGGIGDQGVATDPDSPGAEVAGETAEQLPRTGRGLSESLLLAGLALFLGGVAIRLDDPTGIPAAVPLRRNGPVFRT